MVRYAPRAVAPARVRSSFLKPIRSSYLRRKPGISQTGYARVQLIVWISQTNFTRDDAEAMMAAGAIPLFWMGNRYNYATYAAGNTAMVNLAATFNAYARPAGTVPIWNTRLFPSYEHDWNTLENLTDSATFAKFVAGAEMPSGVTGLTSLDFEPPADSPMIALAGGTTDMDSADWATLHALAAAQAAHWNYSMPSYPRSLHLYNALRGMGDTEITESTYYETCTESVLAAGIAAGTISGDIYALMVSADGTDYSGKSQTVSDALARLSGRRAYMLFPTSDDDDPADFAQIASDVCDWLSTNS